MGRDWGDGQVREAEPGWSGAGKKVWMEAEAWRCLLRTLPGRGPVKTERCRRERQSAPIVRMVIVATSIELDQRSRG